MPGIKDKIWLLHMPVKLSGYDPGLVKLSSGLAGKAYFIGGLYLLQCLVLSLGLTTLIALRFHSFLLLLPGFTIVFTALIRLRYTINVLRLKSFFKLKILALYFLYFLIFILSWLSLSVGFLAQDLQTLILQHPHTGTPSYTYCPQLFIALVQSPWSSAGGLNHTNVYLLWILSVMLLAILLIVMVLPELVRRTGIHKKYQYLKQTHEKIIPYLH